LSRYAARGWAAGLEDRCTRPRPKNGWSSWNGRANSIFGERQRGVVAVVIARGRRRQPAALALDRDPFDSSSALLPDLGERLVGQPGAVDRGIPP
jgi:hypothetical protein